jgi:hypothetical protein
MSPWKNWCSPQKTWNSASKMVFNPPVCAWPGAIEFLEQAPVVPSQPNRADIALFVGAVSRRPGPLPIVIYDWLAAQGWAGLGQHALPEQRIRDLLDLPVPIENWESFHLLFDWESRLEDEAPAGRRFPSAAALGAAVRSFFAQGGRKCYVVRVGEAARPGSTPSGPAERAQYIVDRLRRMLPGYPGQLDASHADPLNWHGLAHLLGLPEVSFVCIPDLPELVGAPLPELEPAPDPPPLRPGFEACSTGEQADIGQDPLKWIPAPRCDETGYLAWGRAVHLAADFLGRHRRDVQLIAALPLPVAGGVGESGMIRYLASEPDGFLAHKLFGSSYGLGSAFVQIAYPWLRTSGAERLPEGLEPPDGVLAGVLARNALTRGAYRSAAGLKLPDIYDSFPELSQAELNTPHRRESSQPAAADPTRFGMRGYTLAERISLFGLSPGGWRLLSDVTASLDEAYRPACINRLVSVIVRAAKRLGEEHTFEASGESLWSRVRLRFEDAVQRLFQAGALRSIGAAPAYQVRCDRSTMSQNDIDAGRVIVEVEFQAAAPVERIQVVLALAEGGQASVIH